MSTKKNSFGPNEDQGHEVLAEYMKRVDAGEVVDRKAFIERHVEVAEQLRSYFDEISAIAGFGVHTNNQATSTSIAQDLRIRCPYCHVHINVVVDSDFANLTCESCGSHFSLTSDNETTGKSSTISTLGHFELVERLGMGAFGTVWKARETKLDRSLR